MADPTDKEVLYSDVGYTGEVSDSTLSVDYWRNKVREFQVTLNALDQAAGSMLEFEQMNLPPDVADAVASWLDDFNSRRAQIVATAETVNTVSAVANSIGIRSPVLSIPQGLAALPALGIVGAAAAVAAVAAIIAYAASRIADYQTIARQISLIETLPPEDRAKALESMNRVRQTQAQGSILGTVAGAADAIKWIAIGAAVFFAYKAFTER